jgi:hypothetical protein
LFVVLSSFIGFGTRFVSKSESSGISMQIVFLGKGFGVLGAAVEYLIHPAANGGRQDWKETIISNVNDFKFYYLELIRASEDTLSCWSCICSRFSIERRHYSSE